MRLRDLQNYWRYRRTLRNAWRATGLRRGGAPGELAALELRRGGRFFVRRHTPDMRVFSDIFIKDVYDVDSIGDPGGGEPPLDTVVDVGGHIGMFAIRIAPFARRVIVCEPVTSNADLLQDNIAAAGCTNVTVERCAVTSEARDVRIYTGANPGRHSALDSLAESADGEVAVGRPLADIFASHGVDRCDFLKIDCEGGEYDILLSASDELLARVQRMALEYHNAVADNPRYTGEQLARRLAAAGFTVRRVPSRRHENYGILRAWRP